MLSERIGKLKKMLIEQSMLIENMMELCFKGYIEKKPENLNQVLALETVVNKMDNDIDELCMNLIALHTPECRNLRMILAIMKINIELERMGDLTVNIARSYKFLLQKPFYKPIIELAKLAKDAKKMLQNAMSAFIYEDNELALDVRKQDDSIDRLHDRIFKLLINNMKISVEIALHMNRISKNYERIADLSTNIAENTIYICQGDIVKHVPKCLPVQSNEG
ncbi:MAG: phosphate signaling complex protein PhoU [Candidatus Cloacimonetes bacterium]|nr:phosphate signaling complex protein PhoU [Candidatus Cloacimonadota bacterium]MCF7814033.1 phosphate signaling complex protein PhoU [Candidatus Cloacimonadota bacterium]MCF7868063.1 phosphate signaling complex protein PhoU [Candidatus Cloacimonadota bacterium]MCF7883486.1 phosphate signaling complex protein PhoU [Candidatus Cloacimonadota bacterium]